MTTLDDALVSVVKARSAMRAAGLDGAELARVARWIAAELRAGGANEDVSRGTRIFKKRKQKSRGPGRAGQR